MNVHQQREAQWLFNILNEADMQPQAYSGRGMRGERCIAVKNHSMFAVGVALGQHRAQPPEPSQDQLGKSSVIYWPHYPWNQLWDRFDAAGNELEDDDVEVDPLALRHF